MKTIKSLSFIWIVKPETIFFYLCMSFEDIVLMQFNDVSNQFFQNYPALLNITMVNNAPN